MKYFIASCLLFQTIVVSAQYEKGTLTMGGTGRGGMSFTNRNIQSLNLILSPKIGFVPVKNLELSSSTHFGIWSYRNNEKLESGFGDYTDVSARYHFNFGKPKKDGDYSWKPFSLYPIIGAGITSNILTSTSESYILLAGVGFSWFLSKNVSLDTELIYAWSPNTIQRDIRSTLGFTYYLGR
jgi:hypothetical protein